MKREFEMKKVLSVSLAIVAAALMLVAPGQAFAASGDPASDPTASQYENPGSTGTDETPQEQDSTPAASPSGDDDGTASGSAASLPFTGFDVGILAIVALLLGATGLALRRFSAVK